MKISLALGLLALIGLNGPGYHEYDVQGRLVKTVEPDTSSRKKGSTRDWYDDAGRRIKSVSATGEVELFTWNKKGHLLKVAGLSYRARGTDEHPDFENPETWVHYFEYREDGSVVFEMDCVGEKRGCPVGAKVDPKHGSTVPSHVHVRGTGQMGQKPTVKDAPEK